MRFYTAFLLAFAGLVFAVPTAMAGKGGNGGSGTTTPPATSAISIASIGGGTGAAPLASPAFEDTVTWNTTVGSLAGWETAEVVLSCYQDVSGDGTIDTTMGGPDIVYSWIGSPSAVFSFSGQGQTSIWSLRGGGPAICRADLDADGWKGGQSSVRLLASTGNFPVSG